LRKTGENTAQIRSVADWHTAVGDALHACAHAARTPHDSIDVLLKRLFDELADSRLLSTAAQTYLQTIEVALKSKVIAGDTQMAYARFVLDYGQVVCFMVHRWMTTMYGALKVCTLFVF
jgi:hypothetical protein